MPLLMVYPNYFATIGMTISSGRDFETRDLAEFAPAVCIVNESFVRQVFAGQDPIGKPCYTGRRGRLLNSVADAVAAAGSHSRSSAWSRIPAQQSCGRDPADHLHDVSANEYRLGPDGSARACR